MSGTSYSRDDALNAIMTAESHGYNVPNYRYDSTHTAQGYFQITNSTWRGYAGQAGVDTSQYPNAMSAPYSVQRQVAGTIYDQRGFQDWSSSHPQTYLGNSGNVTAPRDGGTGAGTLAAGPYDSSTGGNTASYTTAGFQTVEPRYLQPGEAGYDPADPERTMTNLSPEDYATFHSQGSTPGSTGDTGSTAGGSSTPSSSSTAGTGSGSGSGATAMETAGQAANTATFAASELQLGLSPSPGVLTTATGWVHDFDAAVTSAIQGAVTDSLKWLFGSTENWFLRWGLILAGLLLIAIALWAIMSKATDGAVPSPAQTARAGTRAGARLAFA